MGQLIPRKKRPLSQKRAITFTDDQIAILQDLSVKHGYNLAECVRMCVDYCGYIPKLTDSIPRELLNPIILADLQKPAWKPEPNKFLTKSPNHRS